METTFFRLTTRISYGRSPIQVDPIEEIDSLKMLDLNTKLLSNSIFKVNKGKKWLDFIPYESSGNFLISKNVKDILTSNNVQGISFFPTNIEVYPEKEYFGIIIISLAGPILNLEKLNNYEEEEIKFDLETWNGTDFFTLQKTLIFAITKKVKNILEKEKFTNIEIEVL